MSALRPPPTKEEGPQKYKSALEREPDTSVPLFGASLMAQAVKSQPAMQEIQETWVRSLGWADPLEEEMATHSSILAWKIPRTEKPGGLQYLRLQRVGVLPWGLPFLCKTQGKTGKDEASGPPNLDVLCIGKSLIGQAACADRLGSDLGEVMRGERGGTHSLAPGQGSLILLHSWTSPSD